MEKELHRPAKRIRMIVVEPFEAANETDHSAVWFTAQLEIFAAIDEPGEEVRFTFANDSFAASREILTAHCRPYHSTQAAAH